MKWLMEPMAVALGAIIVIVALILFGGFYLKTTQPAITPTPTPVPATTVLPTTIPTTPPVTTEATPEMTTPEPTPTLKHSNAGWATPVDDEGYHKLPDYSTVYNPKGNLPPVLLHQTYDGKFQKEAVVVEALQAPLLIDFALSSAQSPTRSFFFITVRDNETQKLLAQEGFFGPYSESRQKRLFFSSPGTYHINMYGAFVTVDLTLRAPG
jgi:hypothetical protein